MKFFQMLRFLAEKDELEESETVDESYHCGREKENHLKQCAVCHETFKNQSLAEVCCKRRQPSGGQHHNQSQGESYGHSFAETAHKPHVARAQCVDYAACQEEAQP